MGIADYNTDPSNNVAISGINIAEGWPPRNANNAIRQLMADLANYRDAVDDDFDAIAAIISPVMARYSRAIPALGLYSPLAAFNDQLGGSKALNTGKEWRFEKSRYNALDFTKNPTITHYYVSYTAGNVAYNGLNPTFTSGTTGPFKNLDQAWPAIAALGAGSNVVVHLLENNVGYLSYSNMNVNSCSGRNVKIIGEGPQGFTRIPLMREDKDMATFAWVAHGTNGAWKSTVVGAVGNYVAQFYIGQLDEEGIGLPIVSTGMSAALVDTTELASHWDGTTLYVHLPNGAKPDPFNNWLYCNNNGAHSFATDVGTLLFENIEVFAGGNGGYFNCMRFRSTTDALINSAARIGFKKCKMYGCSANAIGVYDIRVVVTEQCTAAYTFNDCFNIHSFNLNAARGTDITYYEDRAKGYQYGYTGFNWGVAPSGSDNGSTCHDGCSVMRVGSRFWNGKDAPIADVNGVDSQNFGVLVSANVTGGASYYPGAFVVDANTGEGVRRRMYLCGCAGWNGAADYALYNTGSAADSVIIVDQWGGDSDTRLRMFGSVKALDGTVINT